MAVTVKLSYLIHRILIVFKSLFNALRIDFYSARAKMDEYLLQMKEIVDDPHVIKGLVVANYECHFDATVTSISFAFFLNQNRDVNDPIQHYLPIINKERENLASDSELLLYLRRFNVTPNHLICRDEVAMDIFHKYILIDYQRQWYYLDMVESRVELIFDNLKGELEFKPADDCELVYQDEYSIAVVVIDYIIKQKTNQKNLTDDKKLSLQMLYDALYFKFNAKEVDPADYVQKRAQLLGEVPEDHWIDLMDELKLGSVPMLEAEERSILAKCFMGNINDIGLFHVPISLENCRRKCALEDFVDYGKSKKLQVLVLTGVQVTCDHTEIDEIGLVNVTDKEKFETIIGKLKEEMYGLKEIIGDPYYLNRWFECTVPVKSFHRYVVELLKSFVESGKDLQ